MKIRNLLIYLLVQFVLVSPSFSYAENKFQYQVGGAYINRDYDSDAETTILQGRFQFYTAPVINKDGPHSEAGFLYRQSSLLLSLGKVDVDIGQVNADGTDIFAGFRYAKQGTPFTFTFLYGQSEADDTVSNIKVEYNDDLLAFELGYYLTVRSAIALQYSQTDQDTKINGIISSETKTDRFELFYKNVLYLGQVNFLNMVAGAAYIDDDADHRNTEIGIAVDYFFNRSLSLGGDFLINSGDNMSDEGKTYVVNVEAFISPTASLGFAFEQFSADEADNDNETVRLTFALRF